MESEALPCVQPGALRPVRTDKTAAFVDDAIWRSFDADLRARVAVFASRFRLTVQEIRQVIIICADARNWRVEPPSPINALPSVVVAAATATAKQALLANLNRWWHEQRAIGPQYAGSAATAPPAAGTTTGRRGRGAVRIQIEDTAPQLLGRCPVFSPRTRCCGLYTLDAVRNCAYGCSYCSIQTFLDGGHIVAYRDLPARLTQIATQLDPQQIYHIGTGQASDSLVWGNLLGNLDALCDFAAMQPNVVLELKTKSANVDCLCSRPIPANVLVTWSLNDGPVIACEEHATATLEERLNAARRVADRGVLVGFHVHPIVMHGGWRGGYVAMADRVLQRFTPREVAMVSMGTLTYTKPVMRSIRASGRATQVLRVPLVEIAGKWSYPFAAKLEMFRVLYGAFAAWHTEVFFYLCMEDAELWQPVFGYSYSDNTEFMDAMHAAYRGKIAAVERDRCVGS